MGHLSSGKKPTGVRVSRKMVFGTPGTPLVHLRFFCKSLIVNEGNTWDTRDTGFFERPK